MNFNQIQKKTFKTCFIALVMILRKMLIFCHYLKFKNIINSSKFKAIVKNKKSEI